jgi:hypothetical protein
LSDGFALRGASSFGADGPVRHQAGGGKRPSAISDRRIRTESRRLILSVRIVALPIGVRPISRDPFHQVADPGFPAVLPGDDVVDGKGETKG